MSATDTIPAQRRAHVARSTLETRVDATVDVDGGEIVVDTGVPFLDHMLDALGRHGKLGIEISCTGDAAMDAHHTVEDVGIVLGQGIREALGDRRGIGRYGHAYAPLDEALARVVIDCSGRPYLHYEVAMPEPMIGRDFAVSLVEEFWRALVVNAALTVHIDLIRARNAHHAAEAIFKAAALALHAATRRSGDPATIPSTKGLLA
ncbi:MAG: imidazoleglycerol-phosphate dehydratase HisB [Chloroflexota bacterium]|nr:imidazoleglycerol-phosphate dehydratase HisB [Chloroflexia bacterium]MDQ3226886.1 imidazoleglycerol-phosphate dehydratase HisB [Chloroflexota bacterium]